MRQWLLSGVMCVGLPVFAEPAMVADNGDEGQVVLTGEKHEACGVHRMAYLKKPLDPSEPGDTITLWGCWGIAKNEVRVKYFVGTEERYLRTDFIYEEIARIAIPETHPGAEEAESYGPSL